MATSTSSTATRNRLIVLFHPSPSARRGPGARDPNFPGDQARFTGPLNWNTVLRAITRKPGQQADRLSIGGRTVIPSAQETPWRGSARHVRGTDSTARESAVSAGTCASPRDGQPGGGRGALIGTQLRDDQLVWGRLFGGRVSARGRFRLGQARPHHRCNGASRRPSGPEERITGIALLRLAAFASRRASEPVRRGSQPAL